MMFRSFLLSIGLTLFLGSCSKHGDSVNIPLVKPPVTAATPSALLSSSSSYKTRSLDVAEVKSRFYSSGPTDIASLLQSIDTRIAEINTRSTESTRTCLSATPVATTLTIYGETKTAYFQCYDLFGDGTGGMLFGRKDSVWYLYTNVGASRAYSTVSLVDGTTDKYAVEAWVTVGQGNAASTTCSSKWYGCSYGVVHLKANSSTRALELVVAGTGFGYCGAQLKSEGTNLFVVGSASGGTSDGTTWTCSSSDTACVLATDTTQTGDCTSIGQSQFELTSLGVTGQSTFGTGITLDGTSTDSVHFGLSVAEMSQITGVASF